jgi:predicted nucleic acid-binding Zn ribbon protein
VDNPQDVKMTYCYICPCCGAEFTLERSFAERNNPASCPNCEADGERCYPPIDFYFSEDPHNDG